MVDVLYTALGLFFMIMQEVQNQVERICEMGQMMRKAVQVDDQHYCSVRERLAQLEVSLKKKNLFLWQSTFRPAKSFSHVQIENKELQDLLAISKGSVKASTEETNQTSAVAQENSPQPASSEWTVYLQETGFIMLYYASTEFTTFYFCF